MYRTIDQLEVHIGFVAKVLSGMPLRQITGFVESLLRLAGLDEAPLDLSTFRHRHKTMNESLLYRGGTGPLTLVIDGTGIKAEGEGVRLDEAASPVGWYRGLRDVAHTLADRVNAGVAWLAERRGHLQRVGREVERA